MEARQTEEFSYWLRTLRDRRARDLIVKHLERVESNSHLGKVRSVGSTVSEMKIDYGPGYRLYFTRRGTELVWLLVGSNKATQKRDILRAQQLAANLG